MSNNHHHRPSRPSRPSSRNSRRNLDSSESEDDYTSLKPDVSTSSSTRFLRPSVSASSLPSVPLGMPTISDTTTVASTNRSRAHLNANAGTTQPVSTKPMLLRPSYRRSSSNETISPFYSTSSSSLYSSYSANSNSNDPRYQQEQTNSGPAQRNGYSQSSSSLPYPLSIPSTSHALPSFATALSSNLASASQPAHGFDNAEPSSSADSYLFTPAGDILPPIATSRSTTALLFTRKRVSSTVPVLGPNSTSITPSRPSENGRNEGSGASLVLPQSPPLPDHPPPPYDAACAESGLNGGSYSSTPSSSTSLQLHTHASASATQLYQYPSHSASNSIPHSVQLHSRPPTPSSLPHPTTRLGASSSLLSASSSHTRVHAPIPMAVEPIHRIHGVRSDSDQFTDSTTSGSDSEAGPSTRMNGESGAIYTSSSTARRRGKGKGRADDGDEISGVSSTSTAISLGGRTEEDDEQVWGCRAVNRPLDEDVDNIGTTPSHLKPKLGLGSRLARFTFSAVGGGRAKGKQREQDGREGKLICTTPGKACAGETETETETDGPTRKHLHLPTSRRVPSTTGPRRFINQFGLGWRSGAPPPPGGAGSASIAASSPLRANPYTASPGPPPPSSNHRVTHTNPGPEPSPTSPSSRYAVDLTLTRHTAFLFEFSRLLSVVPAVCGILFCLVRVFNMDEVNEAYQERYGKCAAMTTMQTGRSCMIEYARGPPVPGRVDWIVAALWALLTAHHCLGLTTGLLMRWRVYYTPLSTLVRLLALQGICWPATHLTLSIIGGGTRPVVAWAVIATTTAVSRSVQIWVTSNIPRVEGSDGRRPAAPNDNTKSRGELDSGQEPDEEEDATGFWNRFAALIGGDSSSPPPSPATPSAPAHVGSRRRERRWDWQEVALRCVLPTGLVYFVMAWAEVGRREWESRYY